MRCIGFGTDKTEGCIEIETEALERPEKKTQHWQCSLSVP